MKYQTGDKVNYVNILGESLTLHNAIINEPSSKEEVYLIEFTSLNDQKVVNEAHVNHIVTLSELCKDEHSINFVGKPNNFNFLDVGILLFTDSINIYIGTINAYGQWKDIPSNRYIVDVTHWMYLDRRPNDFKNPSSVLEISEELDLLDLTKHDKE